MTVIQLPTYYYQQFDADFNLDVPAEGYGGWKKTILPLEIEKTALAVMHAWDFGTREQYPGWHRAVEYIPRAYKILEKEFPKILEVVRKTKMNIVHIAPDECICKDYPGYKQAEALVKKYMSEKQNRPIRPNIDNKIFKELNDFRQSNVFPGRHNIEDIAKGWSKMAFAKEAKPLDDEIIVKDSDQLFAYCMENGINHLIYIGFAIDGCLLVSPGGMVDMNRFGILCSTIKQAVTAIENKETARNEIGKQIALWRVALLFGFVYDADDFIKGILTNTY